MHESMVRNFDNHRSKSVQKKNTKNNIVVFFFNLLPVICNGVELNLDKTTVRKKVSLIY